MKNGPPDRRSVILGIGGPVRNPGWGGGAVQAAGPVWAERWADLIVSDRASGRLQESHSEEAARVGTDGTTNSWCGG